MTEELDTAIDFDVDQVDASSFAAIPNGKYLATVKRVSVVATKDGTGKRLKIQWALEAEGFVGRIVFDDQNVANKSEQAQKIGRAAIKNRLEALGIPAARDFAEMVGRSALVTLRTKTDDYGERTEVTKAEAIGGAAPAAGAAKAGAPAKAKKPPSFV